MAEARGAGEDWLAPVIPIRRGMSGAAAERTPDDASPDLADIQALISTMEILAAEEAAVEREAFAPIEEASLKALGRRSLSRRELERTLARLGYQAHDIDDELDRLEGVGLIDDFALAQRLVARLQERKGLVGSAIKAELARRVIHPAAIQYAMDLIDTGDELAAARELAAGRVRQYGRLDPATAERRLTAWLMRRGFSSSAVRAAVETAIAELRTG